MNSVTSSVKPFAIIRHGWLLLLLLSLPGVRTTLAKDRSGLAETTRIVTENFKTRGTDASGRREWDMTGARGVVEGVLATLETVKVVFYLTNGDTAVVTSPECVYDRVAKIGSSTAPIHVWNKQVVIDGKGYDIFTAEKRIHVRSEVKMLIRQDSSQALADEAPAPTGAAKAPPGNGPAAAPPETAPHTSPAAAPAH